MVEEDKKEEKKVGEEDSDGVKDDRVEPKSLEDRKKEAEEERELLDLEDENKARRRMAGRAEAGQPAEKKVEETPEEYSKRIIERGLK